MTLSIDLTVCQLTHFPLSHRLNDRCLMSCCLCLRCKICRDARHFDRITTRRAGAHGLEWVALVLGVVAASLRARGVGRCSRQLANLGAGNRAAAAASRGGGYRCRAWCWRIRRYWRRQRRWQWRWRRARRRRCVVLAEVASVHRLAVACACGERDKVCTTVVDDATSMPFGASIGNKVHFLRCRSPQTHQ